MDAKKKKKFKLIYVYGITNSYDWLNKFTFYLYAWIPWSNIEIIKEITIHKPLADSFLMGILHYFEFSGIFILALYWKKELFHQSIGRLKWLETVVSLIFFWGMGGVGVSLFVHSKKFIILRICRFVKFFSTNNIINFILQLTFLSL